MKRVYQYGIIILTGITYAVIFDDYFMPGILVIIVLGLAIFLDNIRDYKARRNNKMIDRKGLMKEVAIEANKLQTEGKAQTHSEALKLVKTEGIWDKLVARFTIKEPVKAEEETVKEIPQKILNDTSPPANNWAFDEYETSNNDTPVNVVNDKGHEYAALVRRILDEGTTNWKARLDDLDELQENMQRIVIALKACHDEIKQERQLVSHLHKLKQRPKAKEDSVQLPI